MNERTNENMNMNMNMNMNTNTNMITNCNINMNTTTNMHTNVMNMNMKTKMKMNKMWRMYCNTCARVLVLALEPESRVYHNWSAKGWRLKHHEHDVVRFWARIQHTVTGSYLRHVAVLFTDFAVGHWAVKIELEPPAR